MRIRYSLLILTSACFLSCKQTPKAEKGTFAYDLDFIRQHDNTAVLLGDGASQVLVSPKFQAKVITSTAEGPDGKSFGWVNYGAYDKTVPHINAYGGENRIWIGPEGGPFTIYFKPGKSLNYENWQTPAAFDSEAWTLENSDKQTAVLGKRMSFLNYAGNTLDMTVRRKITLLDKQQIATALKIKNLPAVSFVAYDTENELTNVAVNAWTKESGAPCLWLLDMLPTTNKTTVIAPYLNVPAGTAPANTDYYGIVPPDRIKYKNNLIFFKADGNKRCKFGVAPTMAVNILASYDALHQVLTITLYDTTPTAPYLNEQWKTNVAPYSGDVIQSYNDGPLEDGSRIGESGFYELESASPALFLSPGQSASHKHTVFHFTGDDAQLSIITKKVLGISIEEIKQVFHPAKQ